MSTTRRSFYTLALTATLALGGFGLGLGLADPSAAQAQETIQVEVRAIQLRADGADFDPALDDLKDALQKGFQGYGHFKALDKAQAPLTLGGNHTFKLPGGETLEVSFRDAPQGLVRLGLKVGEKFSTSVRVSHGKTFFQAGLPYGDDGSILVLAITVK